MTVLWPMVAMVFYMVAVAVTMFFLRVRSVARREVSAKYYKTHDAREGLPPEFIVRIGRHYDNLFQVPVLFLITCIVSLLLGLNGWVTIALAWAFVASRMLHTIIHLGRNHVLKRAIAFAAGWLIIVALWIIIGVHLARTNP